MSLGVSYPGSSAHSSSGPSIQAMETCEQLVLPGHNPQAGEEGMVGSRKLRLNGRMRWQLEESSLEDPTGVFRVMQRDTRSCGPGGMQIMLFREEKARCAWKVE